MNQYTEQDKIIKRFEMLSQKYHKMSLLFYELSQSLNIQKKKFNSVKDFKKHIKGLGLDYDKIKALSLTLSDITLKDLKGGV